jgi:hypothetical protein
MRPTAQQIKHAWDALEDGKGMGELRANWSVLVRIRAELDCVIVALAQQIEALRREAANPPADTDAAESDHDDVDHDELDYDDAGEEDTDDEQTLGQGRGLGSQGPADEAPAREDQALDPDQGQPWSLPQDAGGRTE